MLTVYALIFVRSDTIPSENEKTLCRVGSTLAVRLFIQLSLSTIIFAYNNKFEILQFA